MMEDNEKPIRDAYITFARALVALAREHGMGDLKVEFRRTGSRVPDDDWDATRVFFDWHPGRHGSESRFGLRAEAHISVTEKASAAPARGKE